MIWDTLKEGEIEELSPLIIFGLIPFDDCVLKLADTVQVTVDLLRTVDEEKTLLAQEFTSVEFEMMTINDTVLQ